jgi:hypothetical protein
MIRPPTAPSMNTLKTKPSHYLRKVHLMISWERTVHREIGTQARLNRLH